MRIPIVYRLFHRAERCYVAWPGGRGYAHGLYNMLQRPGGLPNELLQLARLEDDAWGGRDLSPRLEVHALRLISPGGERVATGEVVATYDVMTGQNCGGAPRWL